MSGMLILGAPTNLGNRPYDDDGTARLSSAASGRREMNASSVAVPYWPNRNHVSARTPIATSSR